MQRGSAGTAEGRTGSAHRHRREQRRRPERTRGLPAARPLVPGDGGLGEAARPYSRVLLPTYLRRPHPHEGLFIRPEDYYAQLDARMVFGEVVEEGGRGAARGSPSRRPRDRLRPRARGCRVTPCRPAHRGAGGTRRAGVLDLDDAPAGPRPAPRRPAHGSRRRVRRPAGGVGGAPAWRRRHRRRTQRPHLAAKRSTRRRRACSAGASKRRACRSRPACASPVSNGCAANSPHRRRRRHLRGRHRDRRHRRRPQ